MKKKKNVNKNIYKSAGNKFHKKLEKLLSNAGLRIVYSDFNKPGPDIIAELDKKKIIVQCKHSPHGNYFNSLEDEVDSYSNKVKKYKADIAVIALSGYKIRIDQKKLDRWLDVDKVAIWTTPIIENYHNLVKSIRHNTKYQIAGDLNLNISFGRSINVPAIEIQQKSYKFYITKLRPSFLLKAAYVARRAQQPKTYQRYLTKKRVIKEIPDFIDSGEGMFPNNLILASVKKKLSFKNGNLIIPSYYSSFRIIDGQHRLYSFSNVKNKNLLTNYDLPCTIFDKSIKPRDQANIFLKINDKAKKIPPSLMFELSKDFGIVGEYLRATDLLKKFEKTKYFKYRIKPYSSKKGVINITTFCKNAALEELIKDNGLILKNRSYLSDKDKLDLCYSFLNSYFKVVYSHFEKEWNNSKDYILCTNQGYRTLLRLLIKILKYTKSKKDEAKFREVISVFKKSNPLIKNADIKGKFAGEGGALNLANEWSKGINRHISGFDKSVIKLLGSKISSTYISKGELDKAEGFIEENKIKFKGIIRGELQFIDSSTIDYLNKYFGHCKVIKIIYSNIKQDQKNKVNDKLNEVNKENKRLILTKCEKIHERWLGSDDHYMELKADLKKDALANSDHEMCLFQLNDEDDKKMIHKFDEKWDSFKKHSEYSERGVIFDWTLEKENLTKISSKRKI